jgi:hypothetical protein
MHSGAEEHHANEVFILTMHTGKLLYLLCSILEDMQTVISKSILKHIPDSSWPFPAPPVIANRGRRGINASGFGKNSRIHRDLDLDRDTIRLLSSLL